MQPNKPTYRCLQDRHQKVSRGADEILQGRIVWFPWQTSHQVAIIPRTAIIAKVRMPRSLSHHSRPIPTSKPIPSDTASFRTRSPGGKWVTSITTNSVFAKSIRESWFGSVNPGSTRRSPPPCSHAATGVAGFSHTTKCWKRGRQERRRGTRGPISRKQLALLLLCFEQAGLQRRSVV
jgi:hypothetical protein